MTRNGAINIRSPIASLPSIFAAMMLAACSLQPARTAPDLVEEVRSGAYSAQGLYDPQVVHLDNGMTLVAKHRPGIRTVSVRVSVGVGSAHYACGQQHVPHFLEHMLFGSVPGLPEAELERRFFELGATSNARTEGLQTVYQLDIFSDTAMQGLDVVADMLTRGELDRDSFEKTKRIIWQEMGGEPGPVQLQSLPGGPLASGLTELVADLSPAYFDACAEWDGGQRVEFEAVQQVYADHYSPENMVWVVVGDFDRGQLIDWFKRRFGPLPRGTATHPEDPVPGDFDQRVYSGLAWDPGVVVLTTTTGHTGDDYYARALIAHLLDNRLYRRLRIDSALTYTPGSISWDWADWGLFGIVAESAEVDHDKALEIIREIIERLRSAQLPEAEFRTVQLSLLRQWAQAVETNADYAEHYIASLFELRRTGRFTHDELRIARLTPERVHAVARRMLDPEATVIVRDGDRQARIDAGASGQD